MKSINLLLLFFLVGQFCMGQNKTFTLNEIDSLTKNSQENIPSKKDIAIIENIPVYKGCGHLKNNRALKQCMSDKIQRHIANNFNLEIAYKAGIPKGRTRISGVFKIDKSGEIIDVDARASHPDLELEAKRVLSLIPKMKPGYQRGKPVIVPYSVPINLFIEKEFTFPVHKRCEEGLSIEDAKKCSIEQIKDFIQLSFDYDIADRALPTEKSTRFLLEFTINKKGRIENVSAKANHKAIAIEAIRVAKRLPKFISPGKLNGEPTDTPFSLEMTIYF